MLPNDPPDQNNNNSIPPSFGSNFNPHTNPQDPNNPYSPQPPPPPPQPVSAPPNPNIPNIPNLPEHPQHSIHSEVAQHRPRDAQGHFLPYEHPTNPQTPPSSPNPPITPTSPNTPQPIQVIHGDTSKDKGKDDEPLFEAKVNNPFSSFFNWIKRLIKAEGINIKIKPLTAVAIAVALTGGGGIIGGIIGYAFPHSSPILHREVVYQGSLQKTDKGFFLTLPNSDLYTLKPKPKTSINFTNLKDGLALVKGNLTKESFVIEVSEIIPLGGASLSQPLISLNTPNPPNNPDLPNIPNQDLLPKLYSGLTWEVTQRKVLLFTSGKRRIEQEGVYLESAQVADYPQVFIDYYTQELTNSNFKQTFNSSEPSGTTITYAKDDLFLTFGAKFIYSGSGDNKKVVGYKAFIEHN